VRLLLGTQLILWWLNGDRALPEAAVMHARQPGATVFVSKASLWEMAIKAAIGKLDADIPRVAAEIPANGFRWLEIEPAHVVRLVSLPFFADHKDPFDRLLVAQCLAEPLLMLTTDAKLSRYGPTVLVV